jgi:hypothetical protein
MSITTTTTTYLVASMTCVGASPSVFVVTNSLRLRRFRARSNHDDGNVPSPMTTPMGVTPQSARCP